jgi:hypothetical protein
MSLLADNVIIYQAVDGKTQVEVPIEAETVWLSQAQQMAVLFDKDSDTIGLHLKNIFQSGELDEGATTEESSVVRQESKRQVKRKIKVYNLDALISAIALTQKKHPIPHLGQQYPQTIPHSRLRPERAKTPSATGKTCRFKTSDCFVVAVGARKLSPPTTKPKISV